MRYQFHRSHATERSTATATGMVVIAATTAFASECGPHWDNTIGQPGMNGQVSALAEFDDGSGPAIHAGGLFTEAGSQPANHVARWDGEHWSPLGAGTNAWVYALGTFENHLYAGGTFDEADGNEVNFIARWDGNEWVPVGGGVDAAQGPPAVYTFAEFDDGTGTALYVGGRFTHAGGVEASYIARWDGNEWSEVGGGTNGSVRALTVFDDGSGPALYAGGSFSQAGGQSASRVARWDGNEWTALDVGVNGTVHALAGCHDEQAPTLYAGGEFFMSGDQITSYIAQWDGNQWHSLGGGMSGANPAPFVMALECFSNATGHIVYVGGHFSTVDGQSINYIAEWNGTAWSSLDEGAEFFVKSLLLTKDEEPDGHPVLYVGGLFSDAGGESADFIASWQLPNVAGPADLNCDGVVDGADLLILLGEWGACDDCDDCIADLTDDCTVDGADLLILLGNWR